MYTEEIIAEVWQKADVVPDNDAGMWRKDACGAWIQRSRYGDRSSDYGWEIDLIRPAGSEELENLIPLHWRNHVGQGDGRLLCSVTACGIDNKPVADSIQTKT